MRGYGSGVVNTSNIIHTRVLLALLFVSRAKSAVFAHLVPFLSCQCEIKKERKERERIGKKNSRKKKERTLYVDVFAVEHF